MRKRRSCVRLPTAVLNCTTKTSTPPPTTSGCWTCTTGPWPGIEEGEIVKSKVLEIRDNLVVLDIGFKSEGSVPLEEFKDFPDLKPGDEVEVLLEHLEDQEGSVVLSKKKADFMRVWEAQPRGLRDRPAG